MVVLNKTIDADFPGGVTIEEAVREALKLAYVVSTPVTFPFNGIRMTVEPNVVGCVSYDRDWFMTDEEVEKYTREYHEKSEEAYGRD